MYMRRVIDSKGNMKKILGFALFVFALFTIAKPARAVLVQFSSIVDISGCPNSGSTQCNLMTSIPTQTFSVGDSIDFTVTFANSKRLVLFDNDGGTELFFGWMGNVGTAGSFTITNATIQPLGLIGMLVNPLFLASQTSGSVHIGPAFQTDLVGTGSNISFTGYRVMYTVAALPSNPNTYGSNWMVVGGDRVEVQSASVPEPSALLLLASGLAGIMAYPRRRLHRYLCITPYAFGFFRRRSKAAEQKRR